MPLNSALIVFFSVIGNYFVIYPHVVFLFSRYQTVPQKNILVIADENTKLWYGRYFVCNCRYIFAKVLYFKVGSETLYSILSEKATKKTSTDAVHQCLFFFKLFNYTYSITSPSTVPGSAAALDSSVSTCMARP